MSKFESSLVFLFMTSSPTVRFLPRIRFFAESVSASRITGFASGAIGYIVLAHG